MARTENPYDRRKQPKRNVGAHDEFVDLGYAPVHILDDGRRAYPGLTLERLAEWMRDEFARGWNAGEGTMERKTEEEILPKVKRHVWLEGHIAGWKDGRVELLTSISDQWESPATEMLAAVDSVLGETRATKAALTETLTSARTLIAQLVDAHHNAFVRNPPF